MKHTDIPARNQKIAHLALEEGATAQELADTYQLGVSYIVKIVNTAMEQRRADTSDPANTEPVTKYRATQKTVKIREPRPPSERTIAMCEMYDEGATLQEIGDRFEVSRERVRQLLKGTGRSGHRPRETLKKNLAEDAKLLLIGEWLKEQGLMPWEKFTTETGLPWDEYRQGVNRGLIPKNLILARVSNKPPVFTFDDAVAAVKVAYARSGHIPSDGSFPGTMYEAFKSPEDPSLALIAMKWRWANVAEAAGIPTERRKLRRATTLDGMIESIGRYVAATLAEGERPSGNGYDRWSRGRTDCYPYPSVRLVLRRDGMTWQEAVLIASKRDA